MPPLTLDQIIILGAQVWGITGLIAAILFLLIGIDRVDPAARDSYAFRPLLIPGIVMIWPLVLWRWWTLEKLAKHGCPAHSSPADQDAAV